MAPSTYSHIRADPKISCVCDLQAKAADEAPGKGKQAFRITFRSPCDTANGMVGPAAEEDDVTIVTPPRKAARPSRRRPLTTMDVDASLGSMWIEF